MTCVIGSISREPLASFCLKVESLFGVTSPPLTSRTAIPTSGIATMKSISYLLLGSKITKLHITAASGGSCLINSAQTTLSEGSAKIGFLGKESAGMGLVCSTLSVWAMLMQG